MRLTNTAKISALLTTPPAPTSASASPPTLVQVHALVHALISVPTPALTLAKPVYYSDNLEVGKGACDYSDFINYSSDT